MKLRYTFFIALLCYMVPAAAQDLIIQDDFEGNGTINSWFGDNCEINANLANPYPQGLNPSNTVLEYNDTGGEYANVRFDVEDNFDLSTQPAFSLKVYVPSNALTGNQPNQVSFKLQDGTLGAPWSSQCEIIKPIVLDQWQTLSFDFKNDNYINLDPNSLPPTERSDFNRVLIQVNGEGNTDLVRAYIDDVYYDGTISTGPVFDQLVWADEFEGEGAIDEDKWFHQTQLPLGNSWFNGEIQHYTDRTENAYQEDGVLKLTAIRETYTDQGHTKQFTSARLNSKFAFQYGRVEVRAKLPSGVGTWPAIWTLGKNISETGAYWETQGFGTTSWPACGEIDIMEHWGDNQDYVSSAIHTPSSFGGTVNVGGQFIPNASTDFHVYSLEWTAEEMVFAVDGVEHYTYNPPVKNAETWPFDAEQYLLLNVAILPIIEPAFTSSAMEIDYVRVYQAGVSSATEVETTAGLKVFPNPFKEELSVQLGQEASAEGGTLKLYDINGQLLRSHSWPMGSQTFRLDSLGSLSSGSYLIELEQAGERYRSVAVKE